jgi:FkbM family methyltransferase
MKQRLLKAFWPVGRTARILKGHLKGSRIMVTSNSGWAPVFGRYEPATQAMFTSVIRPGMVVYDVGANGGLHSMLFSRLVRGGQVISFEPLPSNCEEIRMNVALNGITNVRVVDAAVGDTVGRVEFKLASHDKEGSLGGLWTGNGSAIEVDLISMDQFIEQGNPVPDFVKIDIEGAESMALDGFDRSLGRYQPLLYVEIHTLEQEWLVREFMKRHGYVAYRMAKSRDNDLCRDDLQRIMDPSKAFFTSEGIWSVLACHISKKEKISNCAR